MDLLIVSILSLIVVPLALLASGPLRIILGLLFVLFVPGYSLLVALFPRKGNLDSIERLALSFGLSFITVALIGLGLNYTPWGISLQPILLSLVGFVLATVGVAFYRRRRLPHGERFRISFKINFSSLALGWGKQKGWDRLLILLLVVAIAGAIGSIVYAFQIPRAENSFTEFYVLGPGGLAEDYPRELALGSEATVIVGIVNREQQTTEYKLEVVIGGERLHLIGSLTLEDKEKWEQPLVLMPTRAGPQQKVEFRLYRGEGSVPYQTLHLWLNVRQKGT